MSRERVEAAVALAAVSGRRVRARPEPGPGRARAPARLPLRKGGPSCRGIARAFASRFREFTRPPVTVRVWEARTRRRGPDPSGLGRTEPSWWGLDGNVDHLDAKLGYLEQGANVTVDKLGASRQIRPSDIHQSILFWTAPARASFSAAHLLVVDFFVCLLKCHFAVAFQLESEPFPNRPLQNPTSVQVGPPIPRARFYFNKYHVSSLAYSP